ncbi:hypothetical protein DS878_14375 [Marinobacter sp. F3R11]|mgnify:CR=1 FL=1|nr:hypothetical protein DS878_14375 [Marinobacter sp. F3R11]
MSLPRLYSFRRCPYAMRARLGILFAGQKVELREVVLRNKPARPVIEESREILVWALQLEYRQQGEVFLQAMIRFQPWQEGDEVVEFPAGSH